jgi:hypothetical protein
MDITGAKALKERLGTEHEVEPQPARAEVDALHGALPVFQWLGVTPPARQAPLDDGSGGTAVASAA